jgi:hypothetical protein
LCFHMIEHFSISFCAPSQTHTIPLIQFVLRYLQYFLKELHSMRSLLDFVRVEKREDVHFIDVSSRISSGRQVYWSQILESEAESPKVKKDFKRFRNNVQNVFLWFHSIMQHFEQNMFYDALDKLSFPPSCFGPDSSDPAPFAFNHAWAPNILLPLTWLPSPLNCPHLSQNNCWLLPDFHDRIYLVMPINNVRRRLGRSHPRLGDFLPTTTRMPSFTSGLLASFAPWKMR